jgi:hypothetical protein
VTDVPSLKPQRTEGQGMHRCEWCEQPFRLGVRRGSARRFCSAVCRMAFHAAARRWALAAIERGELRLDQLRMASPKA